MYQNALPANFQQQSKNPKFRQMLLEQCSGDFDMLVCMHSSFSKQAKVVIDHLVQVFSGVGYNQLLQTVRAENIDFKSACLRTSKSTDSISASAAVDSFLNQMNTQDESVKEQVEEAFRSLTGSPIQLFFQKAA